MKTNIAETVDQRVARLYHERCSGIQIMMMDIPLVMRFGRAVSYVTTDKQLGDALFVFVNNIRKN